MSMFIGNVIISLHVCIYILVSSPDHFFPFLLGDGGKKGLVDLHSLFCSADPQILGVANKY